MGDISIKGKSPILRHGYKRGGTVKVRDINKDGKKEGWEVARAKGAKGAPTDKAIKRSQLKEGGSAAWTRKEGKNPSGGLNAKGRARDRKSVV